jgi:hypothetical protein
MDDERTSARIYARRYGEDPPNISGWLWRPESPMNP